MSRYTPVMRRAMRRRNWAWYIGRYHKTCGMWEARLERTLFRLIKRRDAKKKLPKGKPIIVPVHYRKENTHEKK